MAYLRSTLCFMLLICLVTGDSLLAPVKIERKVIPIPKEAIEEVRIQCNSIADIIFVVDASQSIGLVNYKKVLSFITDLTISFKLGSDGVQFGLVAYSKSAHKRFDLKDTTSDRRALNKAILSTPYYNGTSNTDKALELIIENKLFGSKSGGRPNAPDLVIIVTDGRSRHPKETANAAKKLRKAGVKFIAVGVGSSVNQKELWNITRKKDAVFKPTDYNALGLILNKLVNITCVATKYNQSITTSNQNANNIKKPSYKYKSYGSKTKSEAKQADSPSVAKNRTRVNDEKLRSNRADRVDIVKDNGRKTESARRVKCNNIADVILVVDASQSIGSVNYKKVLKFLTGLTASFKIGSNDVKFGLVAYSKYAHKRFDLKDTTSDQRALNKAILSTPYYNGTTKTDKALEFIAENKLFASKSGGRANAPNLVILVTYGRSSNPKETAQAAKKLSQSGVKLFAIGIGPSVNQRELLNITRSSETVFRPVNYDVLDLVLDNLVKRVCNELLPVSTKPKIVTKERTAKVDDVKEKVKQQETKTSPNVKGKVNTKE